MARDGTLSKNQERAIVALLTSRTITEAASSVGIGERTLKRWLAEDEAFIAAYREARRTIVEEATGFLQAAMTEAVETLRDALSDNNVNARIKAAMAILDYGYQAADAALEERLERIEDELTPSTHNGWSNGAS